MSVAKAVGVSGLLALMLATASAQTASPKPAVATPTPPPKLTATIYVSDGVNVNAYAPGSNGNVFPIARIGNANNGLVTPWGIALDSDARIYIASYEGGLGGIGAVSVYKEAKDGDAIATVTITGPRTGLNHPFGIAVDSSRKIYVANFHNGDGTGSVTIYPADSHGDAKPIATIIGDDTGLDNPSGIAVDSSGKIYVANRGGGRTNVSSITVYAAGSSGNVTPIATITGPDTGLDDPCIAVDSSGKIYAGNATDSITVYPPGSNGNVKPIATITGPDKGDKTGLSQPNGIALDSKGNIYAANSVDSTADFTVTVYRAGSKGNVSPMATLGGPAMGAQGVAVDASGKIYVTTQFDADANNDKSGAITVLSPLGKGQVQTIAVVHAAANSGIGSFGGIAVDSTGKVYVTNEFDYGRVMTYASGSDGNVKPIATIEGSSTGLFTPMQVAVDSSGKIYVSNMSVQRPVLGMGYGNVTVYSAGSDGDVKPIEAFRAGFNKWNRKGMSYKNSSNGEWHKFEDDGTLVTSSAAANPASGPKPTPVMIDDERDFNFILKNHMDLPPIIKIRGSAGMPRGIAVGSNGNVYMAYSHTLLVYPSGSSGYEPPSAEITGRNTGLTWGSGVAVDSAGKIYVVNRRSRSYFPSAGSVTVYPAGANGDINPIAVIKGPQTGLDSEDACGIAVDSSSNIYVVSQDGSGAPGGSVNIYRAGSDGDVAPIASIRGPLTGLRYPKGIALGPPMESP